MVVGGGGESSLEATEASSRAQILDWTPKSSPLTTPPRTLKLRLFGEPADPFGWSAYWHPPGVNICQHVRRIIKRFIFI